MYNNKQFILAPTGLIARDFAKLNGWDAGEYKIVDYPDQLMGYQGIRLHVIQDEVLTHPREAMILRAAQGRCRINYYEGDAPYNEIENIRDTSET